MKQQEQVEESSRRRAWTIRACCCEWSLGGNLDLDKHRMVPPFFIFIIMIRILLIILTLAVSSFCQAQSKRVKQIDCYYKENSSTPYESFLYVYDVNGRLIRIYDEANYNKYQQELVFEYDDISGKITVKGLMPGFNRGCEYKGTYVLTIAGGRITNVSGVTGYGEEYAYDLSYNSQGEWTGLSMGGETVYQNIWENGNMVKRIIGDRFAEVTAFTDIDYPSFFPFFYTPGSEYGIFDTPSPLYHFGNLFGKRHAKLPASAKTGYDVGINYSYTLDAEGNIVEIVQILEVWEGYFDYERLVFHYEDATSSIDNIRVRSDEVNSIFDLSGHRLTSPQKGINIINGKKVIVK